jgi:fibronectin-binding autotransporter adhesin
MANRYFRNTGNIAWATSTNWSTTDGGAADAATPTASDDVFFTNNSGNCDTGATGRNCKSITFQNSYTGTFTLATGGALTCNGNITLSANMTCAGTTNFVLAANCTLTSNGKEMASALSFGAATTAFTFADNWTCNGNVTNFIAASTKTLTGGSLTIKGGSITMGAQIQGTTNLILNGTVTWNGTAVLGLNTTIAGGTITLSGTVAFGVGATLTRTGGTVITTGSTFSFASATLNVPGISFNAINLSATSAPAALSVDVTCVNLTVSSASQPYNGPGSFRVSGNLNTANLSLSGTAGIIITGSGSWTGGSTTYLNNNLTINPSGTFTLSGNLAYGAGTIKYIPGTGNVVTTGSVLSISGTTFDTAGMTWAHIVTNAGTITINSLLSMTDNLSSPLAAVTFAGTAGFDLGGLVINSTSASAMTWILVSGITYRVRAGLTANVQAATSLKELKSSVPGTQARLTLDAAATCNIGYWKFTDIDASGGRAVNIFNGTVVNSKNVIPYIDPILTMSHSFAA